MQIDQETLNWIEKNISFIQWLKIADSRIEHGKIIINYHQGKITSYDICPREMITLQGNIKTNNYDGEM